MLELAPISKHIHDGSCLGIMKVLLKFGIGANSSTFGLSRFATRRYEMGIFKMGVFKMGKIKTGFAENLGQSAVTNVDVT